MSNLGAFINPAYKEKTIEFVLSDRFVDEQGEPVKVKMKSLTQEQLQAIAKRSTREKKVNGKLVVDVDATENINRCLIESLVFPDLKSKELCNAYGVEDPLMLPAKMFLINEYEMLARAFATLNGIKGDDGEVDIPGVVTKN